MSLSVSALSLGIDALEKSKRTDKEAFAKLAQDCKLGRTLFDALWDRVKAYAEARKITTAESKSAIVTVGFRAGAMKYDSEKLDMYFAKQGIDANKFKSQTKDSFIVTVSNKK